MEECVITNLMEVHVKVCFGDAIFHNDYFQLCMPIGNASKKEEHLLGDEPTTGNATSSVKWQRTGENAPGGWATLAEIRAVYGK